ncbi:MAG: site-specific DNA-methyltransferase, partial [Planctomycetes bacterium]|nr:site-specific DNA-methyltransferase [Planctomycetota bacterium]
KHRRPPHSTTNVWAIDSEREGTHPTQKPRDVFRWPIKWHTRVGEVCYEPFSGSGTQIIAAEELGRRCFAMELSPGYCDAAVKRWEASTGKRARTESGKELL